MVEKVSFKLTNIIRVSHRRKLRIHDEINSLSNSTISCRHHAPLLKRSELDMKPREAGKRGSGDIMLPVLCSVSHKQKQRLKGLYCASIVLFPSTTGLMIDCHMLSCVVRYVVFMLGSNQRSCSQNNHEGKHERWKTLQEKATVSAVF